MRVNGIHYFRLLLLSSIYMLGVLGIVASSGGSGGGGNGGAVDCTWPVSGDNSVHLQNILDSGNNLILCPGQTYPIGETLFIEKPAR